MVPFLVGGPPAAFGHSAEVLSLDHLCYEGDKIKLARKLASGYYYVCLRSNHRVHDAPLGTMQWAYLMMWLAVANSEWQNCVLPPVNTARGSEK